MDLPEYLNEPVVLTLIDPPVNERLQYLPYDKISWENFEKLCLRLIKKDPNLLDVRQYGVKGNKQDGIDIYAVNNKGKYSVYQCKNVTDFDAGKIKKAVNEFLKNKWSTNSQSFIICSRESFTVLKCGNEVIDQREILRKKGIHFTAWDGAELDVMMKSEPQLVYDFFGKDWFNAFIGPEWLPSLDLHLPLPTKQKFPPLDIYITRTVSNPNATIHDLVWKDRPTLMEQLDKYDYISLLGWGLSGKSTELRVIASLLSSQESNYYPFLVTLDNYADEDIENLVPPEFKNIPQKQVVLLIDGLDEVLLSHFDLATRKILSFVSIYSGIKVIVSCRTNFYSTDLDNSSFNTLKRFQTLILDELDEKTILDYLSSYHLQDKDDFLDLIEKKQLVDLLNTPYYLVKLSSQFRDHKKISNSKAELFETEIRELIRLDIHRYYGEDRSNKELNLLNLIEKFAFLMVSTGLSFIDALQFNKIFTSKDDRFLLRNASSIIHTTDTKKLWSFQSHHLKEYLAAKVLARRDFKSIQKIVGLSPDLKIIRLNWVNAVSFLPSLLKDRYDYRHKLIEWLVNYNIEVLILLEPERIDLQIRVATFKALINNHKTDKKKINSIKFNLNKIASFCECSEIFDFLLNELETVNESNAIANVLEIIIHSNLANYPKYLDKFQKIIKGYLSSSVSQLRNLAMRAYPKVFKLSFDEFDYFFNLFKYSQETEIRYIFFQSIWIQGFQNNYIDYILEQSISILLHENSASRISGAEYRLSNEYQELATCLEKLDDDTALLIFFDELVNNLNLFNQNSYFKESFDKSILKLYDKPVNRLIQDAILKIFIQNHSYLLYDNRGAKIMEYFHKYHLNEIIFMKFLDMCSPTHHSDLFNTMSHFTSHAGVDLLKAALSNGIFISSQVSNYEYFLEKNGSDSLVYFRKIFKIPKRIPKEPKNFKAEEDLIHSRTLKALFDKKAFIREVSLIFETYEKTTLNYNEVQNHIIDYYGSSFLTLARDILDLYRNKWTDVALEERLLYLETTWDSMFIHRIYAWLIHKKGTIFNETQETIIRTWCDEQSRIVLFTNAITLNDENNWSFDYNAVYLSFFIRRLNLTHFAPELYLDLLSFAKREDDEIGIFEFVESICLKRDITKRVLKNLDEGITFPTVLNYHINYLERNEIYSAVNIIIRYLMDPKIHSRHEILKSYINLGGEKEALKPILIQTKDHFEAYLINVFLKEPNTFITSHLLEQLKNEKDEQKQLNYAQDLIRLQNRKGLKFYINYIKKTNLVPDYSSPDNPLFSIRDIHLLGLIFDLIVISKNKKIKRDRLKDLFTISITSLRYLALHEDNFIKMTFGIFWHFKKFKLLGYLNPVLYSKELQSELKFHWENIEMDFRHKQSTEISIDQALVLYSKFHV